MSEAKATLEDRGERIADSVNAQRRAVAESGGLEVCFNCGQARAWDRMGLEGAFAHLLKAAATSADAKERTAESDDRGRAKGLQAVIVYPSGRVSVVFHHKVRGFESLASAGRFFR